MEKLSQTKSVGFLVWLSGSQCLIHPTISIWFSTRRFNSIQLLSVSASKSVLLLHNPAPCQDWKVLSTIQIHSVTPTVHLRSLTWMPYLEPVAIHAFCLFGIVFLWICRGVQPHSKPLGWFCIILGVLTLSQGSLYVGFQVQLHLKICFFVYWLTLFSSLLFLLPVPSSSASLRWWRRRTCCT